MLSKIFSGLRRAIADPDLAIDLGTANTRLYARGCGIVADEPSMIKIDPQKGCVEAVGSSASKAEQNDNKSIKLPLRAGVIADIDAATSLLQPLLKRAKRFGLVKPRALACAPTDASEKERADLVEATLRAGAVAVTVAPEPLAAAIGAGLDISSPYAQMLVDIGDGVTDIAVIRSGELYFTSAVRTACSDLHSAVQQMVIKKYNVNLYPREAERLTSATPLHNTNSKITFTAIGASCKTGKETEINTDSGEILIAIDPVVRVIVQAITNTVRELPLMTSCEVIESGICLTGGGACLTGMSRLIALETSLDVKPAEDPMHAVINGARMMLTSRFSGLWAY